MRRRAVPKRKSAGKFRKQIKKTKSLNMARPGRGGFRI